MRDGGDKNYRFIPFLIGAEQKMPKKSKKIKETLKKNHYGIISRQNSLEKAKKERN